MTRRLQKVELGVLAPRKFVMFEPLNFCNWDECGHILTEQWAKMVAAHGFDGLNIVSLMLCDEHWIPLWLVPAGKVMVAHTFSDAFDPVFSGFSWE